MFTRFARKEEGFTLIELLVVVAIIALLTAFAVPRLFDAINKSKASRGQADMETVSGALERYYMDKSSFPAESATPASTDLTSKLDGTYLKSNTTYTNGYGRQYIYVSDSNGSFYILVDPKNQPKTDLAATGDKNQLTISCKYKKLPTDTTDTEETATVDVKLADPKVATTLVPTVQANGTISKAAVAAGRCEVQHGDNDDSNQAEDPVIITN